MKPYSDPPLTISEVGDQVSRLLIEAGFSLRVARLNPQPYSKIIGCVIDNFHGAKITYCVENDGQDVNLIFYELTEPSANLRNSFAGFIAFLDWLAMEDTGVTRLSVSYTHLTLPTRS